MAAPDTLDLGPPGDSLLRCSERHWLPREASASCTTQDNDCPRALRIEGSHHGLLCPHSMLEFERTTTLEGGHDRRADHNLRTRQVLTCAQVMVRL